MCHSNISLDSKELILVQLFLLFCLSLTSVPQSRLPLLGVQGEQDHEARLEQVTGPAVNLRTLGWKVARLAAHRCGDGIRRCAVPESGDG